MTLFGCFLNERLKKCYFSIIRSFIDSYQLGNEQLQKIEARGYKACCILHKVPVSD